MVLTGRDVWSHVGSCTTGGSRVEGHGIPIMVNGFQHPVYRNCCGQPQRCTSGGTRVGGHGIPIMINNCQHPLYKNYCGSPDHRRSDKITSQSSLTASNQVPNVIKRVHEAAAVDFYDHAKRCRYENADCHDNDNKRTYVGMDTYQDLEETDGKRCRLDDTGDIDMDVDFNLGQLFSQPACDEKLKQEQQSQPQQQQQQEAQLHTSAQIFQDQKIEFYTMVRGKFELNRHTVKIAEYPESIDDVEYMYQTTHGGDFLRHLNSYPGEDL